MSKKIRISVLGRFDTRGYTRGRILVEGLKEAGADVQVTADTTWRIIPKAVKKLLRKDTDSYLIAGRPILLLAYLTKFIHRKPIIFDTFISDYDTLVFDRKIVKEGSLRAKMLWWSDRISCKIADHNILDTKQHVEYFCETFKLKKNSFSVIPIGADDKVFRPKEEIEKQKNKKNNQENKFIVHFHGTFIPLQGIGTIVEAAAIVKNKTKEPIWFRLVGKGQTYDENKKRAEKLGADNIIFDTFRAFAKGGTLQHLAEMTRNADICLGIFGTSEKADRVIPHKVFESIAAGRPLITGKTHAARDLLEDGKEALLTTPGDAKELAEAIIKLYKDGNLRNEIAKNGYKKFRETSTTKIVGEKCLKVVKKVM